jgi:hypothetical protein
LWSGFRFAGTGALGTMGWLAVSCVDLRTPVKPTGAVLDLPAKTGKNLEV